MSKYNGSNPFIQLSRSIFNPDCKLSFRAKWLYTVLSELEHRYTGEKEDFFFRAQHDLRNDCSRDLRTIRVLIASKLLCFILEKPVEREVMAQDIGFTVL